MIATAPEQARSLNLNAKCARCGLPFYVGERARRNRWGLFHTYECKPLPADAVVCARMQEAAALIRRELRERFPSLRLSVRVYPYKRSADLLDVYGVPEELRIEVESIAARYYIQTSPETIVPVRRHFYVHTLVCPRRVYP